MSDSLRPHGLYSPWNPPGQNPAVGSLSLLQGIFQTQELNPGLLHCRWILYQLTYQFSSVQSLSRVRLSATPWTAACQASLSITNSRSLLKFMSNANKLQKSLVSTSCSSQESPMTAKLVDQSLMRTGYLGAKYLP